MWLRRYREVVEEIRRERRKDTVPQRVSTHQIRLETSIGLVEGEFWSDRLLGIASPLRDADQTDVRGPEDVATVLKAVGLPDDEARITAQQLWDYSLASFASRFAEPS